MGGWQAVWATAAGRHHRHQRGAGWEGEPFVRPSIGASGENLSLELAGSWGRVWWCQHCLSLILGYASSLGLFVMSWHVPGYEQHVRHSMMSQPGAYHSYGDQHWPGQFDHNPELIRPQPSVDSTVQCNDMFVARYMYTKGQNIFLRKLVTWCT